jgi:tetratricopeptide (TPR) repeat protein
MAEYYIRKSEGPSYGPFNLQTLIDYIWDGTLSGQESLSTDKIHWEPISSYPDLYDLLILKITGKSETEFRQASQCVIASKVSSGSEKTLAATQADLETPELGPKSPADIQAEWSQLQAGQPKSNQPPRAKKPPGIPAPSSKRNLRMWGVLGAILTGIGIGFWLFEEKKIVDPEYFFDIVSVTESLPESSEKDVYEAGRRHHEAAAHYFKDTPYHYVLASETFLDALKQDHTYVASLAGYLESLAHLSRFKLISPAALGKVLRLTEVSLTRYPQSPLLLRAKSLILGIQNRIAEAEPFLKSLLEKFPNDAETQVIQGYLQFKIGDQASAKITLEHALRLQKQEQPYLVFGYFLLSELHRKQEAIHELTQVMQTLNELSPTHPYLLKILAEQALKQKEDDRGTAKLLLQTLFALGQFLPVDLHLFTLKHMLKESDLLTPERTQDVRLFLRTYYPTLQSDPDFEDLFRDMPQPPTDPVLQETQKRLFLNVALLNQVAGIYFATPDKVQVGIDLFLVSLKINPHQSDIYQKLADHYAFVRTPQSQARAMELYQKALNLNPSLADVVFRVFEKAMYFYDFQTAATVLTRYEEAMQKTRTNQPWDHRLWLSYGELYHELGDVAKALENFKKARAAAPNDHKILKQMSKIAAEAGYITDAIVLCKQALKFLPEDPEILSRISILTAKQGRRNSAMEWPQARLKNDPEDGWGQLTLGKLNALFNEFENAKSLLESGLKKIPEDKEGWEMLAQIYRQFGLVDLAVRAYQSISQYPDNPKGYVKAAEYLLELGRKDAALTNLLKASNINYRYPGISYQISQLFKDLNYPNETIRYLQTAIDLEPKKLAYQIELGDFLIKNEYYVAAEKYFGKVLEKYPKNVIAMVYLARINRLLGSYSRAHDFATSALSLDPNSPEANKEAGLAFYYLQIPEEAKKYLQIYLNLSPSAPDRAEVEQLMR